ncbi:MULTISPECIES: BTAD domain-containing putative transcriptional regulator [unclassified Kribbella]|uniref:AfsR/SARP family transcriptional regulator n=1 Tax=unclassified Kribbella TaxID=2644121 RepID=UPI0034102670
MTGSLRIELLGPLRVEVDGRVVEAGPLRQQALLAVLALRANRTSTAEELFDAVWADRPPASGLKVLPPYIYRIRKALGVDGLLERTRDGYQLRLPAGSVDLDDFEAAAQQAEASRAAGDVDTAAAAYARALDLHRGEPLSGLPGQYLAAQRVRLTERRYKVLSDRIDLDLECGRHTAVVAELVAAVADRPLDERLAGQLMLALYAGGRQAEALNVYARTRDTLVEQLGVEPAPELRATHQRVLRNEPQPQQTRDELPYQDAAFVGREAELAALVAALTPTVRSAPPVVAIDGMGGTGKTALAVRAARELADAYPDGLLYLQLHGHTPGRQPLAVAAALDHLLGSLGIRPDRIPRDPDGQAAMWRSEVAGRRVLVVLDDALSSEVLQPLLPGTPSCGVIVTSRRQLTGIDAGTRLPLAVLDEVDAAALLTEIIGADRAQARQQATHELVQRCGHLPLAIRIAAARLRHRPAWTVEHLNQRLSAQERRLSELAVDGRRLESAFALSYEYLSDEQQRMFRYLSLMPGRDVDQYGAAALAGVTPEAAEPVLEELVDANLLLQPAAGRFQFHDLLRAYASQLSKQYDEDAVRRAASGRLLEYYLSTGHRAVSQITKLRYIDISDRQPIPGPELASSQQGLAWGDVEGGNVLAAVQQAADGGWDERSWLIAAGFARYFHERGRVSERETLLALGLQAARRLGDPMAQASVLHVLGIFSKVQSGPKVSLEYLRAAVELLPDDADPVLRIQVLIAFGNTIGMIDPGTESTAALTTALELARSIGDDRIAGHALTERAIKEAARHDYRQAYESYKLAMAIARAQDDQTLQPHIHNGTAEVLNALGRHDEAIESVRQGQDIADRVGMRHSRSDALIQLGIAHRALGRLDEALELHEQALKVALEVGSRFSIDESRIELGYSLLAVGRPDESRAMFDAVLQDSQAEHQALTAARVLEGLAAVAEAAGSYEQAAALLDEALRRLGSLTPLYAAELRQRRTSIMRSA